MRRIWLAVLLAFSFSFTDAAAQTAQAWSIQGSGLSVRLTGVDNEELGFGSGGEFQVRYTPGAFSFGVGVQSTQHELTLAGTSTTVLFRFNGFFFEPRYVIALGSDRVAPYLSARFMSIGATAQVLGDERETQGSAISGGGGLLIRLASRVNLDLGVTAGVHYCDEVGVGGGAVLEASQSVSPCA